MLRRATLWAVAIGLAVSGSACRLFHRNDVACKPVSRDAGRPCPPDTVPLTGMKGGQQPFMLEGYSPASESSFVVPQSFGGPTYPIGEPVPLRSGGGSPANELPYPTIPSPGVPQHGTGSSGKLMPPVGAFTTGEPKVGK